MRKGTIFLSDRSNVVQRQFPRSGNGTTTGLFSFKFHRALVMAVFVIIGLIGFPGLAAAGPIIVETEDAGGGGGGVVQGSGSIEQLDGVAIGPQLTANQRVAARLFDEVFLHQQPDVCVLLMTAAAVNHTPMGDFEGPTGFERYVAEVWTHYPGATFAIDEGVTDGDLVTLHWSIGGGQAEPLDGLAILRFEQNMIAESWIEYSALAPAEQVEPNVAPELCPPCREP